MRIAKKLKPSWVETFSCDVNIKNESGRDAISCLYPDEDLDGYWEDGVYFVYDARTNDWIPQDDILEYGFSNV